ncbi:MAG TPA: type II toxin-antitoxin system VapC family toxin [Alphaproteobacteria bacterium]|nr:type II toxin-antitoxin system VapC family toxin [Alphaproteobacteria bacterium]MDP6269683.1 type II toxin-antitoxin system VapC family toxin [Alphaproteobacteria bacterium]MDP7164865.1 type II toxin-antitoxin system VapC family toxin [Alphaproteobacteria bacterium]HJM51999.1 type II toxin-antitoxin system VapC family toxin [Alphaproteobacteria bacterium]
MYLLDTNVVSELRRPKPNKAVLNWVEGVSADQLFVSAVTIGEIQVGIEITRDQDPAKAEEIEVWLDQVVAGYGVLAMDASAFREWARLKHRKSDTLIEDAMIAATASLHRLTVVTRNTRDFESLGMSVINPFGKS